MKRKRGFPQRFVSLLFCLILVFSFSANAAAERSVSVFAATDRHAAYETVSVKNEDSEESRPPDAPPKPSGKMPVYDADGALIWHNHLTELLKRVRMDASAVQPDIILLGGDNVGQDSDNAMDGTGYPMGTPPFSMKAVDAQIAHVFGDTARGLYTYGSHDKNETGEYEDVFFSGPVQGDGYYIYGISYAQMIFDSDEQAGWKDKKGKVYTGKDLADFNGISAQTASRLFLSWVNTLEDHWPILVMSHVPLHAKRGDNSGAWTWTRALNEAAENHDILFLWGHNHSSDKGGKEAVAEQVNPLLLPGDEITVQSLALDEEGKTILRKAVSAGSAESDPSGAGVKQKYELITQKETLRFAYMNAGYIINGVCSLLTLTDTEEDGEWDRLTVSRYSLYSETPEVWTVPLRQWSQR